MKVIVFGATGRVGQAFVERALGAGYSVTAVVRDSARMSATNPLLAVVKGDVLNNVSIADAFSGGRWDAVVNVVGADPLKPSKLVTDTAAALVPLAVKHGVTRYLGITGTAEMDKTVFGQIATFVLQRTPVGHAIRDHDGAIAIVRASSLDWFLVGCPWIRDGPAKGVFKRCKFFPGGMRTIHPGDVALRLFQELEHPSVHREVEGIWY